MGYIQPKTDFKDGEILYGIDLNASNNVIKAGVDDNFDRIQSLEENKQDVLTAGEGIQIENNVISNTQTSAEWGNIQGDIEDQTDLKNAIDNKQDTLISGTNIKTINNQSLLGEGNISVGGGSGGTSDYDQLENRPQINNITLSGNKSLEDLGIEIPTKLSDLTNDNNTVTDANYVHTDNNYTNAEKNKLAGVEDIIVVGSETPTSQTELIIEETDLDEQYTEADYYSTNEVKTNKVWIDGKPIYRKVVDIGNLPNNDTNLISANTSNLDKVVIMQGFFTHDNGNIFTIPYVDTPNEYTVSLMYRKGTDKIMVGTKTDFTAFYGYVILEYTKS